MSNKMLKKPPEETESAPKFVQRFSNKFLYIALGILILLVVGSIVFYSVRESVYTLRLPNGNISLEIADTQEKRVQGLSGRESLNGGLLFVFDESSKQNCFWMKDMKFSIDMVWLDESKKIVTIAENVSPDTYPRIFCPNVSARYGLEVEAGKAEELGILTGEKLSF